MATVFSEAFTGSNGSAWSGANWTDYIETHASCAATIQSNRGRLSAGGAGYDLLQFTANIADQAAFDLTFTTGWSSGTAESYHGVMFRNGEPTEIMQSCYVLEFAPAADEVALKEFDAGGSDSNLATVSSAGINNTTRRNVRIRCVGSALKVKWWNVGGGEPGTWQIEVTDGTWSSGAITFWSVNGSAATARYQDLDDVLVSDTQVTGTAASTGGAGSGTASGIPTVVGVAASTGAAGSGSASGTVTSGGATVTGTAASTGAAGSGSASGVPTVIGVAASTGAAGAGSASGVRSTAGAAASTGAAGAGSASGVRSTAGAAASTGGAGTGTVSGIPTVIGTAAATGAAGTGTVSGVRRCVGTASSTGAAGSGFCAARRRVLGTATSTGSAGSGTVAGEGVALVTGTASSTGAAGSGAASGVPTVVGAAASTGAAGAGSASGVRSTAGAAASTGGAGTGTVSGIPTVIGVAASTGAAGSGSASGTVTSGVSEGTGTANTSPHLIVGFFDGSSSWNERVDVDGTTVAGPGNGGANKLTGATIGASYNNFSSTRLDGRIAFIGIYEGDFTADGSYADFITWAETHYGLTIASA